MFFQQAEKDSSTPDGVLRFTVTVELNDELVLSVETTGVSLLFVSMVACKTSSKYSYMY